MGENEVIELMSALGTVADNQLAMLDALVDIVENQSAALAMAGWLLVGVSLLVFVAAYLMGRSAWR